MRLVMAFYRGTHEVFAFLMVPVMFVSLRRTIFKEILGDMGAIVDSGDVYDCLLLDF